MAKSSKLEDYWRQNNIESLFKELTHTLVQRMPSDPAAAIVQHLQKKFPKSFKTSTDNNNIGIVSKTMASSLQLQSITSPRSDVNIENTSASEIRRRSSTQSQASGIVTIPTAGSAFTDLLKQDTNNSRQSPELSLRNIVFANRLTEQFVKLGKDIQSDRDIIEEELIKPIKTKGNVSSTSNVSIYSVSDDIIHAQTHEEPSVPQLIKYKQQIRTEKDRRLHREKLAEIAKHARDKEQILQSDLLTKPSEVQQQQKSDDDRILSHVVPDTSSTKLIHKTIAKSKEEEEILNDENMFQPRRQRYRERYRNKLSTSRSNSPYPRRRYMGDFVSPMGRRDEGFMSMVQFGICKVCGNIMNNEENQPVIASQHISAIPTVKSFEPQPSTSSVETSSAVVDDWFESASDVSGPRQVIPWKLDDVTPSPIDTNPFQRNRFQPINDNNTDTIQHYPPIAPLIIADDEIKTKRSTTPRMSESDIFVRTPEPKSRRSSSSRSIPSPVTKKHQTDTLAVTNHQLSKTMAYPSSSRPVPASTLTTTTIVPTTERRMSGWSVREHSPDDSDEN